MGQRHTAGVTGNGDSRDTGDDGLEAREAARARRRDRDADARARDLMRPGMGKVFKQIQDAQAKAAREPPKRRKPRG
jgi:hypothetical protein